MLKQRREDRLLQLHTVASTCRKSETRRLTINSHLEVYFCMLQRHPDKEMLITGQIVYRTGHACHGAESIQCSAGDAAGGWSMRKVAAGRCQQVIQEHLRCLCDGCRRQRRATSWECSQRCQQLHLRLQRPRTNVCINKCALIAAACMPQRSTAGCTCACCCMVYGPT